MSNEVEIIQPEVNAEAEFLEILNDFGDPLEILREGISNAIDAHATWIKIGFSAEEIDGARQLVLSMIDNGQGMTRDVLAKAFWGLGYSPSRERDDAIGEKGHGTKIYLRSEHIEVRSQSVEGAFFSICERPLRALSQKKLHQPKLAAIDNFLPDDPNFLPGSNTGTEIKIIGYNNNEYSKFIQGIVKDYLLWFTKVGSVERIFSIDTFENFKVYLKCLDQASYEEIGFGHPFPSENADINRLFNEKGTGAADLYVKRYVWKGQRLENHPFVTFDAVISVEGDEAKRSYNPMLRERLGADRAKQGLYRASDRYGIWLCKDFIPVVKKNDWIIGFGSGSNAFVLLHGFINCQHLRLTANRGDIANTDVRVIEELKVSVQKLINQVDNDLDNEGIYTLREWQDENRTLQQEKTEFTRRIKKLKNRKIARFEDRLLVEPANESELFGLFITMYALKPDIFDFEPIDYNTTKGIDIIARNKIPNMITEGEHSYIELKHTLQKKKFNHAFDYLRWIICWDFDRTVSPGVELRGIEEPDVRQLQVSTDSQGHSIYFLDNQRRHSKIQVIRLKEYLKQRLGVVFEVERQQAQ
jgi:hypothetical protein